MTGIMSSLLAGGVGELMKGAGTLAKDIRSAITGEISPEKKAEIEGKLLEFEFLAGKAQADINLEEAKHKSIFVAGWRPFIGWTCGMGLVTNFILSPLIEWIAVLSSMNVIPPKVELGELITILLAMLGFGAYRTYEKKIGVNNKH